jgi:hypothetical protein
MQADSADLRRPMMMYWTSSSGTILRTESRNVDLLRLDDEPFAAPFVSNSIVGCNLFTFIDGAEVRHFYRALARRVLSTGVAVTFPYRCDGPKMRREMTMSLSRDAEMIRYESTVIRETPREREISGQMPNATTFVAMCSICQRYRFPIASPVWKDLEGLLTETSLPHEFRFTHGICEECDRKLRAEMQ